MRKRRRLHRRERKLRNKKIIIASICLVCIMSVGFAAFQTNLNLSAKGTIKEMTAAKYLKTLVTSSGDGLYKDIYEDNRYVYKGAAPDNYITFNNETWRIISVESDNTIKIIRNESIGNYVWDSKGRRDSTSNGAGGTYCANSNGGFDSNQGKFYGCNAWAITDNFTSDNYSGTVLKDAEINTYLNYTYFNSLTSSSQNQIVNHLWGVGAVTYNNDNLEQQIKDEKAYTWFGKIALINTSDYIKANSNANDCGNISLNNTNISTCKNTNWLIGTGQKMWTISPAVDNTVYPCSSVMHVNGATVVGTVGGTVAVAGVNIRPTLYLSSDIKLTGSGTSTNQYKIVS